MFNKNLYLLRRLSGLTRDDLAQALRVSEKKYTGIEYGRVPFTEKLAKTVSDVLNVTTEELREGAVAEGLNINMPEDFTENVGDEFLKEYIKRPLSELDSEDRGMLLLIRRIKDKDRAREALLEMIAAEDDEL